MFVQFGFIQVLPTGALAYQRGDQVSIYIVWVKGCLKGVFISSRL
jgi:hypothetical protein